MGSLKPGATYVYETEDDVIYAREFGSSKRRVVGWEHLESNRHHRHLSEINDILIMCEQDPAMKELLDQLVVMYNLKKQHER